MSFKTAPKTPYSGFEGKGACIEPQRTYRIHRRPLSKGSRRESGGAGQAGSSERVHAPAQLCQTGAEQGRPGPLAYLNAGHHP